MNEMLELSDKEFEVAVTKTKNTSTRTNYLETNEKIENLSNEIQIVAKNEWKSSN